MTAPTLTRIEGFEHQASTQVAPSGLSVFYNAAGSWSYVAGRVGGKALAVTVSGTTNRVFQSFTATQQLVASFYIKQTTTTTQNSSLLWSIRDASENLMLELRVRPTANGGYILARVGGTGTAVTGPAVNDGAWHHIDLYLDTSGTTWTCDWAVDGSAQTQATKASVSATDANHQVFGGGNSGENGVWNFDDQLLSVTATDYPISQFLGAGQSYEVRPYNPTGEGTDVLGSTNAITFTGDSTGYGCTDAWASGGTAGTSIYVTYASTTTGDAASNYAEVTLADPEADVDQVWGVAGNAAVFAAGTGADNLTVRVVDSTNATLTDIVAGDVSETTLIFVRALIAAPGGGWSAAALAGAKIRIGFSSDTNALPRCSAVMLQAAITTPLSASITTTTVAAVVAVPTPTVEATSGGAADADITTTTVSVIVAIPVPATTADANITTTTVAAVAAVPGVASVTATVAITPTPVTSVVAIAVPDSTADARAPPDTVAAAAAIPGSTVEGSADVEAPTAEASADIETPTVETVEPTIVTPDTVETLVDIPIPTVEIVSDASVEAPTVEAVVDIPTPDVTADADVTPDTVEAVADVISVGQADTVIQLGPPAPPSPPVAPLGGGGAFSRVKPAVSGEIIQIAPAFTQSITVDVNDDVLVLLLI